MKGITHFAAGVAVASFFPDAVAAGAAGNPLYFILGGAFGLLPDTMDFKFYRFFYRHDMEVQPDPNKPDPKMIADAIAQAVNKAQLTREPVKIKLNTIQLSADQWRQYEVRFDPQTRRVRVRYGPVVDTGGKPIGSTTPKKPLSATAELAGPIRIDYQAVTTVDILDGPLFKMTPDDKGVVTLEFIPWHRAWSHSLVIALLFALAGALAWGALGGFIIFGAYAAHVFVDQLGFMGSNLLFPFRKKRTEGLKRMHSGDAFWNFAAVWLSCLIIFWNLYRMMPWQAAGFNAAKLLVFGFLLPFGMVWFLRLPRRAQREARCHKA